MDCDASQVILPASVVERLSRGFRDMLDVDKDTHESSLTNLAYTDAPEAAAPGLLPPPLSPDDKVKNALFMRLCREAWKRAIDGIPTAIAAAADELAAETKAAAAASDPAPLPPSRRTAPAAADAAAAGGAAMPASAVSPEASKTGRRAVQRAGVTRLLRWAEHDERAAATRAAAETAERMSRGRSVHARWLASTDAKSVRLPSSHAFERAQRDALASQILAEGARQLQRATSMDRQQPRRTRSSDPPQTTAGAREFRIESSAARPGGADAPRGRHSIAMSLAAVAQARSRSAASKTTTTTTAAVELDGSHTAAPQAASIEFLSAAERRALVAGRAPPRVRTTVDLALIAGATTGRYAHPINDIAKSRRQLLRLGFVFRDNFRDPEEGVLDEDAVQAFEEARAKTRSSLGASQGSSAALALTSISVKAFESWMTGKSHRDSALRCIALLPLAPDLPSHVSLEVERAAREGLAQASSARNAASRGISLFEAILESASLRVDTADAIDAVRASLRAGPGVASDRSFHPVRAASREDASRWEAIAAALCAIDRSLLAPFVRWSAPLFSPTECASLWTALARRSTAGATRSASSETLTTAPQFPDATSAVESLVQVATPHAERAQAAISALVGKPPPAPQLVRRRDLEESTASSDSSAAGTSPTIVLEWGPGDSESTVAFYTLETCGALGSRQQREARWTRLLVDPPAPDAPDGGPSRPSCRFIFEGAKPGAIISFRVRAFNPFGASPYAFLAVAAAPAVPPAPVVAVRGAQELTLRWDGRAAEAAFWLPSLRMLLRKIRASRAATSTAVVAHPRDILLALDHDDELRLALASMPEPGDRSALAQLLLLDAMTVQQGDVRVSTQSVTVNSHGQSADDAYSQSGSDDDSGADKSRQVTTRDPQPLMPSIDARFLTRLMAGSVRVHRGGTVQSLGDKASLDGSRAFAASERGDISQAGRQDVTSDKGDLEASLPARLRTESPRGKRAPAESVATGDRQTATGALASGGSVTARWRTAGSTRSTNASATSRSIATLRRPSSATAMAAALASRRSVDSSAAAGQAASVARPSLNPESRIDPTMRFELQQCTEDRGGEEQRWSTIYSGANPRYRVTGLTPATAFAFRVRSINADGIPSSWSRARIVRTLLSSPRDVVVVPGTVHPTEATVAWRAVGLESASGDEAGGAANGTQSAGVASIISEWTRVRPSDVGGDGGIGVDLRRAFMQFATAVKYSGAAKEARSAPASRDADETDDLSILSDHVPASGKHATEPGDAVGSAAGLADEVIEDDLDRPALPRSTSSERHALAPPPTMPSAEEPSSSSSEHHTEYRVPLARVGNLLRSLGVTPSDELIASAVPSGAALTLTALRDWWRSRRELEFVVQLTDLSVSPMVDQSSRPSTVADDMETTALTAVSRGTAPTVTSTRVLEAGARDRRTRHREERVPAIQGQVHVIQGLRPNAAYEVRIRSVAGISSSAWSTAVVLHTRPLAPFAPAVVRCAPREVTLRWHAAEGGASRYTVEGAAVERLPRSVLPGTTTPRSSHRPTGDTGEVWESVAVTDSALEWQPVLVTTHTLAVRDVHVVIPL